MRRFIKSYYFKSDPKINITWIRWEKYRDNEKLTLKLDECS
jgi:hypothetical protein